MKRKETNDYSNSERNFRITDKTKTLNEPIYETGKQRKTGKKD